MNIQQISNIIVDESDNIIYLSDPDTYELLYLNHAARTLLGIPFDEDITGMKCYEINQKKDKPCDFCTNKLLSTESFYKWEHYNQSINRHFLLHDKLVEIDGKLIRLEIATDITEKEQTARELNNRLSVEETLIRCISTLKSSNHVDAAINSLLKHIGLFYHAERAYTFEINYANETISNTYEWCAPGVTPQIHHLQNVPLNAVDRWMEAFAVYGHISISSLGKTVDHDSLEYQILEPQGIERLIAVPLIDDTGDTMGFIGVDNPMANFESAYLLSSISNFIVDDLGKRKMIAQLERMSYEDALTGLKNRNRYFERLKELQEHPLNSLGVIYLDINGLKRINDTYGHSYGDELIKRAANYLKNIFHDDIFRIGGDEFVTLCINIERKEFNALLDRLREQADQDESCSISIGAKWDHGDICANDLITDADELMYIHKQSYYHSSLANMPHHRAVFVKELVKAINDGYYVVQLQPKVEIKTRRIYGAEALIRRKEKDGTLTGPGKFISIIEEEGAVRYIDLFVLETVCQTLHKWEQKKIPLIQMAVNFSRITLMEKNIIQTMLKICEKYDVDPCLITIEVTESIGRMDMQALQTLIVEMMAAGFSISLDDFGSQYSNLAILSSIDFDELKFDKSLIDNIAINEKSSVIIQHAIKMGKMLNKTNSVAEGIETTDQLKLLENMDCDYGQGYLFSKPVFIDEFERMMQTASFSDGYLP